MGDMYLSYIHLYNATLATIEYGEEDRPKRKKDLLQTVRNSQTLSREQTLAREETEMGDMYLSYIHLYNATQATIESMGSKEDTPKDRQMKLNYEQKKRLVHG
jgi:hypothetical protein